MKSSTAAWLAACKEDLLVVTSLLESGLATGAASFHAQQCVEKALKAVLEEFAGTVPRIHDLDRLFAEAHKYLEMKRDESVINKLNMLYIESRYPGAFGFLPSGLPTLDDVKNFHIFAEEIYETVTKHLTRQ